MVIRPLLMVACAGLVRSACNPLLTNPVPLGVGGELEQTSAVYSGASPAWIEVSVSGAPAHAVYALALVRNEDLTGPTARSCAGVGGAVVPCTITLSDVRLPDQRLVPANGSTRVRLMSVWSGERIQITLVCVDSVTQELDCPDSMLTGIRAVDDGGTLVGDLAA